MPYETMRAFEGVPLLDVMCRDLIAVHTLNTLPSLHENERLMWLP